MDKVDYDKLKFRIPDVIYLNCHDDDGELMHPDDEVTWCEDDITGHNIKYVRDKDK